MKLNRKDFDQSAIQAIVDDFATFIDYIVKNRPKLTPKGEVLGNKVLFELNEKMLFQKKVNSPTFQQKSYPLISLLFDLSIGAEILVKRADEKGNLYLELTTRMDEYSRLNVYEKYIFLLEMYWTYIDFELVFGRSAFLIDIQSIVSVLQIIADNRQGDLIAKGTFSGNDDLDAVYSQLTPIFYHMAFFGFCEYEEIDNKDKKYQVYEDKLAYVELKNHGVQMCQILQSKRRIEDWNIPYYMGRYAGHGLDVIPGGLTELSDRIFDHLENAHEIVNEYNQEMADREMFFEAFTDYFPEDELHKTVMSKLTPAKTKGNYIFNVSLSRRVWRTIKLSHKHTLYDLHIAIQTAFNFYDDHLYTFYMDGKMNNRNYYNSDMCDHGPFVHQAVIGQLDLYTGKNILYLFDFGDMWQFNVNLLAIVENEPELEEPRIMESKGEAPSQYVYYDDDNE